MDIMKLNYMVEEISSVPITDSLLLEITRMQLYYIFLFVINKYLDNKKHNIYILWINHTQKNDNY